MASCWYSWPRFFFFSRKIRTVKKVNDGYIDLAQAEAAIHRCFSKFCNVLRKKPLLKACNFIKRLQHKCFPVNFENFLRTTFSYDTSGGCFYTVIVKEGILNVTNASSKYSEKLHNVILHNSGAYLGSC